MNPIVTVVVSLISATCLSTIVSALPGQLALAWGSSFGNCGLGFGCGVSVAEDPVVFHKTSSNVPSTLSLTGPTPSVTERDSQPVVVDRDRAGTAVATCNPGEVVTGGGFRYITITPFPVGGHPITTASVPVGNSWRVSVFNPSNAAGKISFLAVAECASLVT
jgi:hypothetical protein